DARFCTVFMFVYFCFCHPPTLYSYTLSLHDALPISSRSAVTDHGETSTPEWRTNTGPRSRQRSIVITPAIPQKMRANGHDEELRSEEHTSELQSRENLVCRLLREKKTISMLVYFRFS